MRRPLRLKTQQTLYPGYLAVPALLIFSFFFILPVLFSALMSFTDWNINRFYTPKFIGLENFTYIFKDPKFRLSSVNTAVFAVATAFLKTVVGLGLALALNRQLKSRNLLRTLFYLPAVLSMVVVGIMMKSIFRMDGLFNQFLSLIGLGAWQMDWIANRKTAMIIVIIAEVWRWAGFNMAIFLAGLQSIPSDYYEAARIDGASSFQQLRKITLPLLISSFTVNIVFNTIGGLKVFEQVFVITGGGPGFQTQVLSTYIFNSYSSGLLGRSTAMSILLFVVVYLVATLVNRLLSKKEVDL